MIEKSQYHVVHNVKAKRLNGTTQFVINQNTKREVLQATRVLVEDDKIYWKGASVHHNNTARACRSGAEL